MSTEQDQQVEPTVRRLNIGGSYPKIFHVGSHDVENLLESNVYVTEKIDGSQFGFGLIDGNLMCRSRGRQMPVDYPDHLFTKAVDFVQSIRDKLPDNMVFYGEYLSTPKHNTIAYQRTPSNYIMLFGLQYANGEIEVRPGILREWAKRFGLEVVPYLHTNERVTLQQLESHIGTESVLGGHAIEGLVITSPEPWLWEPARQVWSIRCAKLVSAEFQEKHRGSWKAENTTSGGWEAYKESFRTEARWQKAVQHLEELGQLDHDPRDIGGLMKAIHQDIAEEEGEAIKDRLYKLFSKDLMRKATAGFPEWYKAKLIAGVADDSE